MKKSISYILLFLHSLLAIANEDSLIVFSLLEQAKQTENKDSANFYIEQAMSFSKKQAYLDGILTAAKQFGNQYAQTGELEKSVELYMNLLNKHAFNTKQLSTLYNQIGIYHVYMGHYDSTETYFLKALAMRKELNDSLGIGASLNNLGNVILSTGDYDKATSYYYKALKIRESINDSNGIASSTNNLGMVFYKQEQFKPAIKYYRRALNINNQQQKVGKEILILNNLGNIYDEMSQLDSSKSYYQIAINKADQYGDSRLIAISYGNMGVTLNKMGQSALAIKYFKKAQQIRKASKDLEGQAIVYNNLATAFISLHKNDSAIYYFNKSLEFSKIIAFNEATRDNYLGLATAYKNINAFEKAFFAHQQYSLIKDSMLNKSTAEQIAIMQTKYETEKKETAIAQQQTEISNQELKIKNRNFLLVGLSSLALLVFIAGYFIFKQQRLKQQRLIEENLLKDQLANTKLQNKLHDERLRISTDLNENIGSQLTFIISSIDNMKYLFKTTDEKLNKKLLTINEFTRTTITQLRDTIWALNKDEISFEDLKSRLYNYIQHAELAQEQTKFIFSEQLKSDFTLNAIEAVSIYRIVQEAINNSIKYAAASIIKLDISETSSQISIQLSDDGIGFNMGDFILGNGLINMQNRAKTIAADFKIDSTLKKGTIITLSLNKDTLNAV